MFRSVAKEIIVDGMAVGSVQAKADSRHLLSHANHPGLCSRSSSSASGLRIMCDSMFLPYRKRVMRLVLYQQHSVIRDDSPHSNRSFLSLLGDASTAATSR